MTSKICPHCAQAVAAQRPLSMFICPHCNIPFAVPRTNQWTVLVVPFLSILHYVQFVL